MNAVRAEPAQQLAVRPDHLVQHLIVGQGADEQAAGLGHFLRP